MANCTGANAQYSSMAGCLGACATYPVGSPSDTSGNTLGCRVHYAGSLAQATPATYCTVAGPTGGGEPGDAGSGTTCGTGCDSFCAMADAVCNGTNKQFANVSVCMSTLGCASYSPIVTPPYSTADTATNDFGCRMYWLTQAAESSANMIKDCPYIVPNSSVCKQ
jgi:hypothetical protein